MDPVLGSLVGGRRHGRRCPDPVLELVKEHGSWDSPSLVHNVA